MFKRYYSQHLGRFLSTDPVGGSVGSSQSWNKYVYVNSDPINMIDPTGEYGRGTGWTDDQWLSGNVVQNDFGGIKYGLMKFGIAGFESNAATAHQCPGHGSSPL